MGKYDPLPAPTGRLIELQKISFGGKILFMENFKTEDKLLAAKIVHIH